MSGLRQRSRQPELMEIEPASFAETDQTFRELETINRLTLAYRPTLLWLNRVADRHPGETLRVLDVACGHGDMLRRVWAWSRERQVAVELTGVDLSPDAIRSAEAATPADIPVRYLTGDVFALPAEPAYDVIMSSLFTHHLFDDDLTRFLAWMHATARRSWLVNDLHRHPIPYHFVRAWVRLAGFGRFVRSDAPISVARGFTRAEWLRTLRASGIDPTLVDVTWHVPFRYLVGCLK